MCIVTTKGSLVSKKLMRQIQFEIRFYIANELRQIDRANRESLPCFYHFRLYIRISSKHKCTFFQWKEGFNKKYISQTHLKIWFYFRKKNKSNGSVTFENMICIGDSNAISDIFKSFAYPLNQLQFRQNLIPGVFVNRETVLAMSNLTFPKKCNFEPPCCIYF